MPAIRIETAAVIGTGMMGPGIAVSLALGGVIPTIISRSADGAAHGRDQARKLLETLESNGLATPEQATWTRQHLAASADFDAAVAAADLVVESAPESMDLKQMLFAKLDAIAKPEALLATNTSGLSINEIARACARPERVMTAHFWNPPHLMRLVEIVRGEQTAQEPVAALKGLLERCGKRVVIVQRDRPGQLGNRLQHAMIREALHIVAEGIASPEDVDLAAKEGFGLRLPVYGIFEHADAVGLDLVLAIQDYVDQDLCASPHAPPSVRERVKSGALGVKTGKGFYDWSQKSWDGVRERRDNFILHYLKSDFARE